MRAGEGCGNCHHCNLAALWGRDDVMTTGHLRTDCSFGELSIVGSDINVSESGSLTVVTKHLTTIPETEIFPI